MNNDQLACALAWRELDIVEMDFYRNGNAKPTF